MLWLKIIVTNLSSQRLEFDLGPVDVGLVIEKVAL
jgi:hypothetical protein